MDSPDRAAASRSKAATSPGSRSGILLFDIVIGYEAYAFGIMIFVFAILCVALLEGWLLRWRFRWPSPSVAFRDALVANLLSGLIGVLIRYKWPSGLWLGPFLAMYLFTVVLETIILQRRRGLGWAHSLKASAVVNAASYVALLLLVLLGLGRLLWW